MGREEESKRGKGTDGSAGLCFASDLRAAAHGVRGKEGPLGHGGWLPASTATWLHPVAPANRARTPSAAPEGLTSLGSQVLL